MKHSVLRLLLPRLFVVLAAAALASANGQAADVTSTLVGSGPWTTNGVWSSALFPNNGNGGLTYDAVVNSGSVNIPALTPIIIEALTLSGGQISGDSSLQLNAASTWTGGTLAGGTTGLTIKGAGPLTVSGGGTKFFSGAVTNAGTLLWQQGQVVPFTANSTLTNTGVLDLRGNGTAFNSFDTGTVTNAAGGVLRRSVGTGEVLVALPLTNNGTIDVQSGELRLESGGSSSGSFQVAAGATLNLGGGTFTMLAGATNTGAGAMTVGGATVNLDGAHTLTGWNVIAGTVNSNVASSLTNFRVTGGVLNVNAPVSMTNLELSVGRIAGSSSLVSGSLSWTGGVLSGMALGSGMTTTVSGGGTKLFSGAVTNAGTLLWQQGQIAPFTANSTLTNTGVLDLRGNGTAFNPFSDGTVVNAAGGVLRRSVGTGEVLVALPLTNNGTIDVQTGDLRLESGGSSSGSFQVAAGATLNLGGGTFTMLAGATNTGAGAMTVGGATVNLDGAHTLTGWNVIAGTVNSNVASSLTNFRVTGGVLNVNAPVSMTNLELSVGRIAGSSSLVSGSLSWTGGVLSGMALGSGMTTTVSGGGTKLFSGAVTNAGTLLWQQGQIAPFTANSTLTNTGVLDLRGNGTAFNSFDTGTVTNAAGGVLRRSVGTGEVLVALPLTNNGTIDVQSGELRLESGGSSSGSFQVAAGATLNLGGGTFTMLAGATNTGAGAMTVGGATVNLDGAHTLTGWNVIAGTVNSNVASSLTNFRVTGGVLNVNAPVSMTNLELSVGRIAGSSSLVSGSLSWTGGVLSGMALGSGMTTTVSGGGTKFFSGAVTNAGTLLWQQGQVVPFTANSTLTNTGVLDLRGNGTAFNSFDTGTVTNAAGGVLRRSVGTGEVLVALPLTNNGTIEAMSGTLNIAGGLSNINVPTNTLAGGAYRAIDGGSGATLQVQGAPAIATIAAGTTVELSGAGAAILFGSTAPAVSLANNAGTLQIRNGHRFTMTNALSNTGSVELGGAGLAAGILTSAGNITNGSTGSISGHGTINNSILNGGTVRAAGGTLVLGSGGVIDGQAGSTVQVDAGATLNLSGGSGASDAEFLIHNGAGLNLGANNFLVSGDYQNANFGAGNAFNPRANVTGAGAINATGSVTQTLGGSVTGGATSTATMNFGNVHVGTMTTLNYQINNVGASGPSLRGAVQTAVGMGNLTDGRIGGSGITTNFGPIAVGANSGNRAVTFNATTAGALGGQQVQIVGNFANVAGQVLKFTGAAYRLAAPVHSPEPVNLGNRHVGDAAPSQVVSVQNNVAADGFSELLNATIGSPTGGVTTNSGSFSGLAPAATNNTSLTVGYSTAAAGNKAGTATLTLVSDGAGSSGLGLTSLAAQTVNVTGGVYRLASAGAHTPEPVNFGIVHVGDVVSQLLSIGNTAANDGFSERLAGSIGSPSTGITTSGGSFTGVTPGGANSTSLSVGVNTATAGARSGTATITLASTGAGTSGLADTALTSQTVNVSATVNNFAVANLVKTAGVGTLTPTGPNQYTLDLGSTVQGLSSLAAQLGVMNNVAAPADSLGGSFTLTAPGYTLAGFSTFSGLTAGATQGGLMATLPSTTAGTITGQITLAPQSTNPRPFSATLPTVTINLTGKVYRQADFDEDGDVDGGDLARWRTNVGAGSGATHVQGDANADGTIDGNDFLLWQRQLGGAPAIAAGSFVPEPGCGLLLAVAMGCAVARGQRVRPSNDGEER